MKLREPVALVGLARSPVGKMGGMLAGIEPHHLLAACFNVSRADLFSATPSLINQFRRAYGAEMLSAHQDHDPSATVMDRPPDTDAIKDFAGMEQSLLSPQEVYVGSVRNGLGNIARVAVLEAGFPVETPAVTVDRQCASSLEALAIAAAQINSGMADRILIGGVESSSRAPWMMERPTRIGLEPPGPYKIALSSDKVGDPNMGETAEILADEYQITRREMDEFATESHRRAAAVPVPVWRAEYGDVADWLFEGKKAPEPIADEAIRASTTPDVLAKLRPVFRKDGRVTAGNACPINDGAASCYVLSRRLVEEMHIQPQAWITGITTVGLDPRRMGLGPALAIPKLLKEQGLTADDVDFVEINEAFAAQVLAVLKELKKRGVDLPKERLNLHGGAIALGHPLGATGIRLLVTLTNVLRTHGGHRGIASLCVGGGQGMAVLLELPH